MKYLNELKQINMPKGEFVIFGSDPLAIRGLRENHDIDILVTEDLWKSLSGQYPITKKQGKPDSIYKGHIQFLKINYKDWRPYIIDNNILISDSEIINNFPFVKMKYLLQCKKLMNGDKHKKDIKIIEEFINQMI